VKLSAPSSEPRMAHLAPAKPFTVPMAQPIRGVKGTDLAGCASSIDLRRAREARLALHRRLIVVAGRAAERTMATIDWPSLNGFSTLVALSELHLRRPTAAPRKPLHSAGRPADRPANRPK